MRAAIAEEVRALKDPRIGFVTITGVDTSPDLRSAIVYYSVLGSDEERAATMKALRHATPHIGAGIGHKVRLKYTPKLTFRLDESIERATRLSGLFRDLAAGEPPDEV